MLFSPFLHKMDVPFIRLFCPAIWGCPFHVFLTLAYVVVTSVADGCSRSIDHSFYTYSYYFPIISHDLLLILGTLMVFIYNFNSVCILTWPSMAGATLTWDLERTELQHLPPGPDLRPLLCCPPVWMSPRHSSYSACSWREVSKRHSFIQFSCLLNNICYQFSLIEWRDIAYWNLSCSWIIY